MNPQISVVMCIYKEPISWIQQAIDSILKQTYQNFEFIIVLDNPDHIDAKNLLKKIKKTDKRIRIIYNQNNIGGALSRHKGISISRGEYIAIMDADDISLRYRLKIQLEYMQANKSVDVLFCSSFYSMNEQGKITGKVKNVNFEEKNKNRKKIHQFLECYNYIPDPTSFFRKLKYIQVGGYRDIKVVFDYDLWLQFLKKEFVFYNITKPLICYRMSKNSLTYSNIFSSDKILHLLSKNYQFFQKNGKDKYSLIDLQKIIKESPLVAKSRSYQLGQKILLHSFPIKLSRFPSFAYKLLKYIITIFFSKYHRVIFLFSIRRKILCFKIKFF